MANLTVNQKSFIALMTKSDEHATRGFALIGKRSDPEQFFSELALAGMFAPERNPGPVRVDENPVLIPLWPAATYLLTCAHVANYIGDVELARKVMDVVRSVSRFKDDNGNTRDNFHTFRTFAEILGALPTSVVTPGDV